MAGLHSTQVSLNRFSGCAFGYVGYSIPVSPHSITKTLVFGGNLNAQKQYFVKTMYSLLSHFHKDFVQYLNRVVHDSAHGMAGII
jgi:hypothetical protein